MKNPKKPIEYKIIKEILGEIISPRDKALCALLYGTGARLNELLQLKRDDLRVKGNYLVVYLYTEKNWQHPIRAVPIKFKPTPLKEKPKPAEAWIVKPVMDWLEVCGEILFPFSDRWARKIVQKHFGCHPHLLRHSRLTHLVELFGLKDFRLQRIAGWRDIKSANPYIHLDWKDTIEDFE